jgi:protein-disulfide isomerase
MKKMEMPAICLRVAMIALLVPFMAAAAVANAPTASDEAVSQKATALLSDPSSPVIGNPHADVAVVEFFDYACPYCKAAEPRLEAMLKSDKGTKLVLKEFPILTPESMIATKAALASVKQGKYTQFHQTLMAYKGPLLDSVIFDTAKNVGLDVGRLRKDMAAPEITDEILANFNLARSLRIFQTPGFIVGNHILTGPSADIDFPKAVAAARAK